MNQLLEEALQYARENGCSDLHLNVDGPAMIRKNGKLIEFPKQFDNAQTTEMILSMLNDLQMEQLKQGKDIDFTYVDQKHERQRVNVYRRQDKLAADRKSVV